MSGQDAKALPASAADASYKPPQPPKPQKPPNPVWRMMGLPNFRLKLPSRNWTIFLTITGSWSAAVYYDRREKKRIQKKWTKVVEHIAQESLDTSQLARKLTIYISAPPADGIVTAREHFQEYVKPILVAAAMDWDAVEGRREGDVRAGLAERIRKVRKKKGEVSEEPIEEGMQELLEATRERSGIKEWQGTAGDIIIGRHTWKEYVRGLHEGWLGPLNSPRQPEIPAEVSAITTPATTPDTPLTPDQPSTPTAMDDASPTAIPEPPKPAEEPEKPKEEEAKPKKKKQPPPFNTTSDYSNSTPSPNCPPEFPPSAIIPLPHLLGFFNFPIRMYRFLNRRQVADDIGRQTAAAVLAAYRPFESPRESHSGISTMYDNESDASSSTGWEQQRLLKHEEAEWHKNVRERKGDDDRERVWLDGMVLDPRIAERMRRFELDMDGEERAKRAAAEKEDPWWRYVWPKKEEKKNAWEGLE
ncbi:mitochondrial import inner membrane translocase subunit Tim54 [Clohesyomyces aquaticus]|uniref:Mitochondrial import inner membrane translocase subunit TIM54 n=1 Tax=Clohesyomyces aquaticus TaxID=1231657 RepID=A0A1Y1YWC0_9PLEO|nr:mitochondrial import inner membrane translocase subunit Tim54 [Clohesyomyces aquaticus]